MKHFFLKFPLFYRANKGKSESESLKLHVLCKRKEREFREHFSFIPYPNSYTYTLVAVLLLIIGLKSPFSFFLLYALCKDLSYPNRQSAVLLFKIAPFFPCWSTVCPP